MDVPTNTMGSDVEMGLLTVHHGDPRIILFTVTRMSAPIPVIR